MPVELWQPSNLLKGTIVFFIFLLELGWDYVELPQLVCDSHKLTLHHNVLLLITLVTVAESLG